MEEPVSKPDPVTVSVDPGVVEVEESVILGLIDVTVMAVEVVKVDPESSEAAMYQLPTAIRLGLNVTAALERVVVPADKE
jgi:hypothetical protein